MRFAPFQTGSTAVLYRQCREILKKKGLGDYELTGMDFQGIYMSMNDQNIPNRHLTDFIEAEMGVEVKFKSQRILSFERIFMDFLKTIDDE